VHHIFTRTTERRVGHCLTIRVIDVDADVGPREERAMTVTSPPPPAPLPPPPAPPKPAGIVITEDRGPGLAFGALAVMAAATILFDLTLNSALDGWAMAGAVAVMAIGLPLIGHRWSGWAQAVALTAVLPALFLALRSSPWLAVWNVPAAGALLALGAALSRGGNLFDLRATTIAGKVARFGLSIAFAPAVVVQLTIDARPHLPRGDHRRLGAVARGILLAAPVVLVLTLALASGDAVFASFIDWEWSIDVVPHLFPLFIGLWLAAAFVAQSDGARAPGPVRRRPLIGAVEGSVVLGGLILVYALFALARLLVALRGDAYVLETTGLTYAEYARSGFFQLLGAAALTVVVLGVLRAAVELPTAGSRWVFGVLSAAAVVLTLVMVHSSIVRLGLYEDAFGLTMLRLGSTIFAWWIGAVLVLVGAALCGLLPSRSWLPGAVVCSAVAALLIANLMNPEKFVMTRNVERARETGRFDLDHALDLSADARPTLLTSMDVLDGDQQAAVRDHFCNRDLTRSTRRRPPETSEPTLNLSERDATAAVAQLCGTS
jgi:hypothetical protein